MAGGLGPVVRERQVPGRSGEMRQRRALGHQGAGGRGQRQHVVPVSTMRSDHLTWIVIVEPWPVTL